MKGKEGGTFVDPIKDSVEDVIVSIESELLHLTRLSVRHVDVRRLKLMSIRVER